MPPAANAQLSCNASLTLSPQPGTFSIGDTLTITVNIGGGLIQGGTANTITIPQMAYGLDCFDDGGIAVCNNDGPIMKFAGNIVNVDCVDSSSQPVVITASHAAGADSPNIVVFDFGNDILEGSQQTCTFRFDVTVAGVSSDATPFLIQTAAGFGSGGNDPTPQGECDNGLTAQASGTAAIPIEVSCDVSLDKQVSCDGGATWVDAGDFGGVGLVEFCQGFAAINGRPADDIRVRWFARSDSDEGVELQDCAIADTNGVITPPGPFDLLTPGEVVQVGETDVGSCTLQLDDGEPNTSSVECQCVAGGTAFDTATDSDRAEFRCDTCDVDISKRVSCETSGGGFTPLGEFCLGWNEYLQDGGTHEAEDVRVQYDISVLGSVGVVCTPSEQFPGNGLTDTNPLLLPGAVDLGVLSPGASVHQVQRDCSDALDDNEPDTGTLNCFCLDRGGQPTDIPVSASDDANFACRQPNLTVTKVCAPQDAGANAVNITVIGGLSPDEANLVNCQVTDTYFPEDPLCDDGTTGTAVPLTVTPAAFDLAAAAPPNQVAVTGQIQGLLETACNTVSVTCQIAESGGKTITRVAEDECEVRRGECLTRTPGFWGTHPHITQQVLASTPITNCGVLMTSTLDSVQGSATEDMCSVGTDPKTKQVYDQQVQLERQCMAALLNVAATEQFFEASCDAAFAGAAEMIAECCTAENSVCRSSLAPGEPGLDQRTINSCIQALDAFNNNDEAEPDVAGTIFESPGPADPSECQDSKNNGFLNARPRRTVCKGKGCN